MWYYHHNHLIELQKKIIKKKYYKQRMVKHPLLFKHTKNINIIKNNKKIIIKISTANNGWLNIHCFSNL